MARAKHISSMAARAEADMPRPKQKKGYTPKPEWKDTDPPFMRKVWEAEAGPEEAARAELRRASAIARHERRLDSQRRLRAARRGVPNENVIRDRIIERDESTCYLCGKRCQDKEIHLDHIIPLALGGPHTEDNLAVACAPCNQAKGANLTDKRPRSLMS
jgi:5-methylcytosine-specific restriction endonuclease McrA